MALYHRIWAKFLIQTVWYNVCSSAKRSLNVRTERPKTVKWPVACKRSISTIWVCLPIEYVLPLITVATNHSRCSNQSPHISSASSGGFAPKALQGLESKPLRLLAWQVALTNEMFLFMDSLLILLTLPCTAVRTHTKMREAYWAAYTLSHMCNRRVLGAPGITWRWECFNSTAGMSYDLISIGRQTANFVQLSAANQF